MILKFFNEEYKIDRQIINKSWPKRIGPEIVRLFLKESSENLSRLENKCNAMIDRINFIYISIENLSL